MPLLRMIASFTLAATILVLLPSVTATAQNEGSAAVYRINEGRNELALVERFSIFVEHSSKIRRVMDFDEEVITVQVVEGTPTQFRVYALHAGVTTITVVDEHGRSYSLEVLVRGDVRHLESHIRRSYPNDVITIEEINEQSVRLVGWVSQPENIVEIEEIARQFYPTVMNHMKTGGVQQVLMKCTVLEVQRAKLRRLGMNFSLVRPEGFLISTPGPITPITSLTPGGGGTVATLSGLANSTVTFGFTKPNSVFQGFVQAMLEEGMLKSQATPMIVTHNGRPANFLSGGETPVPIPAGLGTTGFEFREYGIQMNAVPYILGNGRVRLEVETIIRDQDFANTVTVSGTTITAFKTNSANTQVEMNFGEALVIAGLISQKQDVLTQKIPFFGELPYIGAAFSRKTATESERELIIMVTPEYVSPAPASQFPQQGPGMFTDTPTDKELFGMGLLEVPKYGDPCENGCDNCLPGGNCQTYPHGQQMNSSPDGQQNGGSCSPPGYGNSESTVEPPMSTMGIERPTVAKPVSSSRTASDDAVGEKGVNNRKSRTSSGNSRSGRSGLISPTMR
jgi:pilus assembly protein CpaC